MLILLLVPPQIKRNRKRVCAKELVQNIYFLLVSHTLLISRVLGLYLK